MMALELAGWAEAPAPELAGLYQKNPFPLYHGTPLAGPAMGQYQMNLALRTAEQDPAGSLLVRRGGRVLALGRVSRVDYLSDHWGLAMGSLGHLVADPSEPALSQAAYELLLGGLVRRAREMGLAFVSASAPGAELALNRALEETGFRFAEGFLAMNRRTNRFRQAFAVQGLRLRKMEPADLDQIAEAYDLMPVPSRFLCETWFDPGKVKQLNVKRFGEVADKKLGLVLVAELQGRFAGALICLIDRDLARATGIKTNPLSGMGIIVHPRAARQGVALAMIEFRQSYYHQRGVEFVSLPANFNNSPMLLGLSKMGFAPGAVSTVYHLWLDGPPQARAV